MSATNGATSREEVLQAVLRFVETANRGDLQAAVESHAPDCLVHYPGLPTMNMAAWTPFFLSYFAAFPDMQIHVNPAEAIIEGNRMAGPYTITGTQTGDFMGMPATGKQISVFGINIFHVRDGKIIEEWDLNDSLSMLRQLGVIPAPEAPATR
jgi:steroid delta-isomerase-like uncharacterized protein